MRLLSLPVLVAAGVLASPALWHTAMTGTVPFDVAVIRYLAAVVVTCSRSTTWRDWTAYGFLFAGSVEVFQGLFLPERSATYVDVVANTLGALIGAVAAHVVHLMDRASDR